MFVIRFVTETFAPNNAVTMRWGPHWDLDRGGVYTDGAWTFELDEDAFPDGIEFKFVLVPDRWMRGDNLRLAADRCVGTIDLDETEVSFPPQEAAIVERGVVPQRFFVRNLDPQHVYDVVVVGSGMGGGLLASELADGGADVLLLEAGSYLFPTHVGNLPRRLQIGRFDKHVWSLWQDFRVVNYRNTPGSAFAGGQGFNLGGRSLFWGGLIPRQRPWELVDWPAAVRDYLLGEGYPAAEVALNRVDPAPSAYQDRSRELLESALPGFTASDATMAIQYRGATGWSIPAGLFSTADLLMEDRLTVDPGHVAPTVNLNVAVRRVDVDPVAPHRVIGVTGWDLLGQKERSFRGRTVVLAAGTLESARIALNSGLTDPNGRIGRGITDHTIRYRHFTLPPDSPHVSGTDSAKVLLTHPGASTDQHAFHLVVELGADFNQGRYVGQENLARQRQDRAGWMLCELVVMSYGALNEANSVIATGDAADPLTVTVHPTPPTAADVAEADALAAGLFAALDAEPVLGEDGLGLLTADLGGVAHEVGTLRMAGDGTGVVDENLRFLGYENLYACDNSVFPASPAANPSLTLAALALRLGVQIARHG